MAENAAERQEQSRPAANATRLWALYEELDSSCPEERVETMHAAIRYLGGRTDYRWPIPIQKRGIKERIPVRQPKSQSQAKGKVPRPILKRDRKSAATTKPPMPS